MNRMGQRVDTTSSVKKKALSLLPVDKDWAEKDPGEAGVNRRGETVLLRHRIRGPEGVTAVHWTGHAHGVDVIANHDDCW